MDSGAGNSSRNHPGGESIRDGLAAPYQTLVLVPTLAQSQKRKVKSG